MSFLDYFRSQKKTSASVAKDRLQIIVARERNLRRMLAETPPLVPVATGARDHATLAGLCPAEAVWAVAGGDGQRSTLADLSMWVLDDRDPTEEAA